MIGLFRNRRMGWPGSCASSSRSSSMRLTVVMGILFLPIFLVLVLLITTTRAFAKNFQAHLISEKDLSLEYQLALNVSLNTVPCCDAADWHPNKAERSAELIPRIIHQTYKVAEIPEGDWATAHGLCLNLHRAENGWQHMFWTDQSARDFLEANYPDFLETYDGYPYTIQRVDAMRYFILYHYGGIYIDLDIGCARVMDSLLGFPAFFPITVPVGISNDLIGSRKGHPLMRHLGRSLQTQGHKKRYLTKYITVFFTTGPMFVNRILRRYWSQGEHAPRDEVMILPKNFYSESFTAYFMHFPGSSWHGNDALSVMIVVHYGWIFAVLCIVLYALSFRYRWAAAILNPWGKSPQSHSLRAHAIEQEYELAGCKHSQSSDGDV